MSNLLTAKHLAEKLNCCVQVINTLRKEERIPFVVLNGGFRYNFERVYEALEKKSD